MLSKKHIAMKYQETPTLTSGDSRTLSRKLATRNTQVRLYTRPHIENAYGAGVSTVIEPSEALRMSGKFRAFELRRTDAIMYTTNATRLRMGYRSFIVEQS
eukprot:GHVU01171309.1.p2 GENE.GHVU01171309.1~~GHVU01171309.1.p2  ORF type:complete len:101 (-),score=5.86 GHVU01171309.1:33-335(-)